MVTGSERRRHTTARVVVGERYADIDTDLVPTIEAAWRLGISTDYSCQGRIGPRSSKAEPWGYILFGDVDDLRRFLACFDDTALSERRFATLHVTDPVTGRREPIHRRRWETSTSVRQLDADGVAAGIGRFRFLGRLGFPTADIPRIEAVLSALPGNPVNDLRSPTDGSETCAQ
jgi:hypothetical protein